MDVHYFHTDRVAERIARALRIALLVLVLVPLTACISLGPPRVDKPEPGSNNDALVVAYGRELVQALMKKYDVPGFSVVLVDREKVLWAEGFGWASIQNAQPLTADSAMQVGSITKIFTAIAIMQLVEQGKVDLDEKLTTYLPEFSIQSRFADSEFSIRQMLTHHSGLPSDLALGFKFYPSEQAPEDLLTQFKNVPTALGSSHMASPPGEAFSYSNLAFSLLGSVIERTSGENYGDYVVGHILSPLGMKDSAVMVPGQVAHLTLANGITREEEEVKGSYLRDLSAGGIAASANDMGKFLQLFLNNTETVLSDDSLQLMATAQNGEVELDGDFRIGLAFFMSVIGQEPVVISHGGDIPPYHASMRILPEAGLGIVMMVNSDRGAGLVNYAADQILNVAYESINSADGESATSEKLTSQRVSMSEKQAERYTGLYYAGPSMGFVEIENKGGDLKLEFLSTGLATVKMVPLEGDKFGIKLRLFGFIPLSMNLVVFGADAPQFQLQFEEIKGEAYFWLTADGVRIVLAMPIERKVIPEAWLARVGTYTVADKNESYFDSAELVFDEKSGFLQFVVRSDPQPTLRLSIETLSDDQASIMGIGRLAGEVIDVLGDETLGYGGIVMVRE